MLRGYPVKRIDTGAADAPRPDYEVQTPLGSVICEVKELVPNAEDKEIDERLKKYRNPPFNRRPTGKRPRAALKIARVQLGRFRNDPRPCMLVLFDTTYHNYLTPADIDAAMYGDPLALFAADSADYRIDFTHGGNRALTDKRGLYLGALAVLRRDESEGGVRLDIYHNAFAEKRLSPACFPDSQDRHYVKERDRDEHGHGWHEYVGPQNDAKN